MTNRKLFSFIDALVAGRRPVPFQADPEEAQVLRTAIELRAARPGDAVPDDQFVSDLFHSLVEQSNPSSAQKVVPIATRRPRAVLFAAAASLVLVAGTFVATKSFDTSPATTAAIGVPHASVLRTGTFESPSGEVLGQVVAYEGHPSWVFMNVGATQSTGKVLCKLQLNNGSIVSTGTIDLHGGTGELSKYIHVDIHRLRGAKLFTSTGAVLASATFD
jgi:hypothetical protein